MIDRAFWGKGRGTEAWQAVSDWLFTQPYVRKQFAGCMAPNHGMRRIFANTGFTLDCTLREHYILDGQPVSLIFYSKFKNETK